MNQCIFTGRSTGDVELRYTSGKEKIAIGKFNLAVDDGYGDQKTTSFFDITAFGKRAEALEKYCPKGTRLVCRTKARQERWEKDGKKFSRVAFILEDWEFAQSKSKDEKSSDDMEGFINVPTTLEEDLPFN